MGISAPLDAFAPPERIESYARIVREKSGARMASAARRSVAKMCAESESGAATLAEEFQNAIFRVGDRRFGKGFENMRGVVADCLRRIEERQAEGIPAPGLATGFDEIDRMTNGFQPGDLIVIAARPGVGKTTFALNIAQNGRNG